MECIFCKIINKEIPTKLALENEKFVVFDDIHPKAPVHLLIVARSHIGSVKDLDDAILPGEMILTAKELAREKNLEGYKLLFNVGRAGGQEVDHLHLHLMGGY